MTNSIPAFTCILALLFMSCSESKEEVQPEVQPELIFTSFSPDTGPFSTVVTIKGSGFSTNIIENVVSFNGVLAVVQDATATTLTTIVPKAAGTGPVKVQRGTKTASSGTNFNFVDEVQPEVQPELIFSSFSPETGPYSTIVTIKGSGFSTTISENVVSFNDVQAVVQDATTTTLTAIVPKAAGTGHVTVQRGTKTASSGTDFNFISTITVSTLAGSGTEGFADGNGSAAQFDAPHRLATDAQGNVYVADNGNHRIRKITPSGEVSTFAGSGTRGFADGNGSVAQFDLPSEVATDAQGNVYVADNGNHRIRKITPSGEVSTFAGSGTKGFADGNGSVAQFNFPHGVATDAQGNVYVADNGNHRIRKITPSGEVSTFAGSGTRGFADGNGSVAQFDLPSEVATDAQGNVYVVDVNNCRIRKITPSGVVSTLPNSCAGINPTGLFESFGIAADAQGNVYVAGIFSHRIRKITPSGVVSTLAGSGIQGFADGNGSTAQFNSPRGVATDTQGNVYVADARNHRIRKITIE